MEERSATPGRAPIHGRGERASGSFHGVSPEAARILRPSTRFARSREIGTQTGRSHGQGSSFSERKLRPAREGQRSQADGNILGGMDDKRFGRFREGARRGIRSATIPPLSGVVQERWKRRVLDGTSHAIRWNDPYMPVVRGAEGPVIEDLDGHRIVDYWQGHFANLLGHNPADHPRGAGGGALRRARPSERDGARDRGRGLRADLPDDRRRDGAADDQRIPGYLLRHDARPSLHRPRPRAQGCRRVARQPAVRPEGRQHPRNVLRPHRVRGLWAGAHEEIVLTRFNDLERPAPRLRERRRPHRLLRRRAGPGRRRRHGGDAGVPPGGPRPDGKARGASSVRRDHHRVPLSRRETARRFTGCVRTC